MSQDEPTLRETVLGAIAPASASDNAAASATCTIAAYERVATLGQGGQAVVYVAREKSSGKRVAMKTLLAHCRGDQKACSWLLQERRLLLRLAGCKNVVQLAEDQPPEDVPVVLMELIEGLPLDKAIPNPLPSQATAGIGCQILVALEAAHQREIVHRDLKPTNVLLSRDGKCVTVIDWGVAGEGPVRDTEPQIVGTPMYMSPEQSVGERDCRADIYSLGCTLYELLTAVPAFTLPGRATPLQLIDEHRKHDGPNPRIKNRSVPRGFAELVVKAMLRDPKKRFQTAKEMNNALEWYIDPLWKRCLRQMYRWAMFRPSTN